jgi:N-acetylated-alpha-linked acidic dipeptidase
MPAQYSFTSWSDPATEKTILDSISIDEPWALVEEIVKYVRLSGTEEERKAFDAIMERLDAWGVPYTLHEPMAFISHPLAATVRTLGPDGKDFRAKTVAMSVSTDGAEIEGQLVYIPGKAGTGYKAGDIFASGVDVEGGGLAGKIAITEGMAAPGKVADLIKAGAIAGVFVNPGTYIHEGICTTIWGTPDLYNQHNQPSIPAVAVNNSDGLALIEHAKAGGSIALSTTLETGWRTIPILVADVKGTVDPDKYVLLHGHVDGWHYGAGDNATGDATLAEIARVFNEHKDLLKRSLKLAWWSGHSHGRYAGSTWFADTFGIDLANNCLAQVNCDSPGCRWAVTYNNLTTFPEAVDFVNQVIPDTTGISPETDRPIRAGDYSFNNIGITGFYMLSSTMTDEDRAAKNYYAVGGCGANIQWHTEDDLMFILDKEILLRDIKMYAASVLRVINAPVVPFNFLGETSDIREALDRYQAAAEGFFDFGPTYAALDSLERALDAFYRGIPADIEVASPEAARINAAQLRLARILIPINFTRAEPFFHDPALSVPPLPNLSPALGAKEAADDPAKAGVLRATLTRGQNKVVWALQLARETVA